MNYPLFCGFIASDIAHPRPLSGLKAAIGLAKMLDAAVSCVIGTTKIAVPNLLASATVERLVAEEHRRSVESTAAALKKAEAMAREQGVAVRTETVMGDFSQLKNSIAGRARVHGLLVAESGVVGDLLDEGFLEALLFQSGRPAFIVPSDYASPLSCERVLIAWDGSAGAARAVWDGLPLLRLAKSIEIVTVSGEKDLTGAPPASALASSLGFLGKDVRAASLPLGGGTAAGAIRAHAEATGAGLIVQGAYGRSRWSEFILGGVTREMLRESAVPVLMSH